MNKASRHITTIIAVATALLLLACSKETLMEPVAEESQPTICFAVSEQVLAEGYGTTRTGQEPTITDLGNGLLVETRVEPIGYQNQTRAEGDILPGIKSAVRGNFYVWGYDEDGNDVLGGSPINATYTKTEDGKELYVTDIPWPVTSGEKKLKFWAVSKGGSAPEMKNGITVGFSQAPYFKYAESDMLYAESVDNAYKTGKGNSEYVKLLFRHICSSITFVTENNDDGNELKEKIKKISITNLHPSAYYNGATRAWTDLKAPSSSEEKSFPEGIGQEKCLVPQTLTNDPKKVINIHLSDKKDPETTAYLPSTPSEWLPGYKYTYTLKKKSTAVKLLSSDVTLTNSTFNEIAIDPTDVTTSSKLGFRYTTTNDNFGIYVKSSPAQGNDIYIIGTWGSYGTTNTGTNVSLEIDVDDAFINAVTAAGNKFYISGDNVTLHEVYIKK